MAEYSDKDLIARRRMQEDVGLTQDEMNFLDQEEGFGQKTAPSSTNARTAQAVMGSQGMTSGSDSASSGLMAIGGATGNPYLIGAGATLGVLNAGAKRRNQEEDARYMREQNRINNQQQALARLMDMSNSLRNL